MQKYPMRGTLWEVPYAEVPYAEVPYAEVPFAEVPFVQVPYAEVPLWLWPMFIQRLVGSSSMFTFWYGGMLVLLAFPPGDVIFAR
jgi:hypothetical protein